jgi:hypothetical protein
MAEKKTKSGRTKVNKDNIRARVDEIRASRAAESEVDVFSVALGPTEECLSSKQILRAMIVGITDSEREHVLHCPPCIDHLRRISTVDLKSDSGFVGRILARIRPGGAAMAMPPVAARVRLDQAALGKAAFHAILATINRVQKLNLNSPASQIFKVDLVPLFDLEPYQLDRYSFELKGAFQAHTVNKFEKVDINRDGKCDFVRITFTGIKPSRQVTEAISDNRSIFDTVRLVGHMKDEHKKNFEIVAQANLEFQGK